MKHFTIDSDNNFALHATKKAAKDTGLPVFSTEAQFADAIGNDNPRLLQIWNSLPGVTPVKKFTSRKIATERIWKALQSLGGPAAQPTPEFRSCVEAVEALSASEPQADPATPFDGPEPAAHIEPPAGSAASEQLAGGSAQVPDVAPAEPKASKKATRQKKAPKAEPKVEAAKAKDAAGPREGSKMAQVIALLKRENGATLEEIMEKMAWQRHTVRGFMAGAMKKAGYSVESFKSEAGDRTYRINAGGR